jgi:peroxiredoxin
MKKSVYLLIIAALLASCKSKEPQFILKGKIAGADSVTFILQERVPGKYIKLDSAVVKNGEFTIKGAVQYPKMVLLLAKDKRKALSFFIENSEIGIAGNLDSLDRAKVTGSKTHDEFVAYQASLKPFNERNDKLYQDYKAAEKAGDKAKMAELEKRSEQIYNEETAFTKDYTKAHPASYLVPTLLNSISYELEANTMDSIINALDTAIAKVQIIKDLKERVAIMKTVAVGQKAPDFTLNDVHGKPVALSSKIGSKLLLIDFWAAWCGPCRAENPNVVKVYKEFHNKGFDVFGVSLDRSNEDWVQAIEKDNLTWTQVSDLQYWGHAAAKLYAVNAIPANFLLDEKGTIIARNLRGDDLLNEVKQILTTKN